MSVRVETCSGLRGLPGQDGSDGSDGQRGSRWWFADTSTPTPDDVPDPIEGDVFLFPDGDIYRFDGATWTLFGNLEGPPGAGNISTVNGDAGPDVVLDREDIGIPEHRLYISAQDFGVVGDGTTNDRDALMGAIEAAAPLGARVVLDAGPVVALGSPLPFLSGTHLDLNGRTLLRAYDGAPDGDGTAVIRMRSISNVVIENGVIDGNGDNFPNGLNGYNLTAGFDLNNITYRGVTFRHVIDNHAIDLTDATNIRILDCNFFGFRHNPGRRDFAEAIQIDPNGLSGTGGTNRNWLIRGCTFGPSDIDPANWGPFGGGVGNHAALETSVTENLRIVNNHFEGMGSSGIRLHGMSRVTVADNTFRNCRFAIWSQPNSGYADPSVDEARGYGIIVTGNTIEAPAESAYRGIQLNWADNFTVSGNVIDGTQHAIQLRFCRAGTVSGNSVAWTRSHGMLVNETGYDTALQLLGHTCDIVFTGNQVKYAGSSGIFLQGPRRCMITGNSLMAGSQNTASPAIMLDQANSSLVTGNFNARSTSPNQDTWGLFNSGSSGPRSNVNWFSGSEGDESL